MKGIIRIGNIEIVREHVYPFFYNYLVRYLLGVSKRIGIRNINVRRLVFKFPGTSLFDRLIIFYLEFSCTELELERLRDKIERKYYLILPGTQHKRGHSTVLFDVSVFKYPESCPHVSSSVMEIKNGSAQFNVLSSLDYYKGIKKFTVGSEKDYEANLKKGMELLEIEYLWNNERRGEYKKGILWKSENGNFCAV